MEARPDLEALLRHADWLARLARRLVADVATAEDLVQETWTVALRRPPDRARPARPWLAGVVRRLAALHRRRESRPVSSPGPSAVASPAADEAAMQVELQRTIADAVLALAEPFRSAILLRYFRDLSSVQIARELGVPETTVRSRLKRGLERLRHRLDQVHGGDGRTWISALAPLIALDRSARVSTAVSIGGGLVAKWIVSGAVIVVAIVLMRAVWESATPPDHDSEMAIVAAPAAATEEPDAPVAANETDRVVVELPVAIGAEDDEPNSDVSGPKEAIVRGRFVLPDGRAAEGVDLLLQGHAANSDREREPDSPESWESERARSDAEGRFEVHFAPPRAFSFRLDAALPDYSRMSWSWYEILTGTIVDLGEVTLGRMGTILGRILDTEDPPQSIAWRIRAHSLEPTAPGGDLISEKVAADPTTGEFRFDAFPAGPVLLSASAPGLRVDGPRIEVRADEITEATIYFRAPDAARRIQVTTLTRPFGEFVPEPGAIRLERGGRNLGTPEPEGSNQQSFVFTGLDPGLYDVFIEDERFEPWSRSGVQPGESVRADLAGNAGVMLEVRDAATEALVPSYQLDLVYVPREGNTLPILEHRLLELGDDPPEGGFFGGLIPQDCTLRVSAESFATAELHVLGVLPNERRGLYCRLVRGTTLAGSVLDSTGAGAESVRVELHAGEISAAELCDPEFRSRLRVEHQEPAARSTEVSGRFVFQHVGCGTWTVYANAGPTVAARTVITIAGEETVEVELPLPTAAFLSGRVHLPETMSSQGFELAVLPGRRIGGRFHVPFAGGPITVVRCEVSARGDFRLGPIGAGDWVVVAALPWVEFPFGTGMVKHPGEILELERLHVESEVEIERDYDLRSTMGSLLVDARVRGEQAGKLVIELVSGTKPHSPTAGAVVAEDGVARIANLVPGEWHLVLRDVENRWRYGHPEPIRVDGGKETSVSVEAEIFPGELEVRLAGSDTPLASAMLSWRCETPGFQLLGMFFTDARGIVVTGLPLGSYRISSEFPPDEHAVVVDWTHTGPSPRSVELPRPRD